jgi:diguanylate cyclase (GGDEF)-like protein
MADLGRRLRPGAPFVVGTFVVAGVSGVGAYGWLPLLPPAAALAAAATVWLLYPERRQHPEYVHASAFLFVEAMLALAIVLANGPRGYALIILAIPVILVAVIFPRRVVVAAICVGAATVLATTLSVDLPEVRATPAVGYSALFTLVSLAVTALVLRDLDDASRRSAFVDVLTGTLNRSALTPRVAELAHQTEASQEPVAVIVADVDDFKAINDELGHGAGDAALREVARRLNACLNAFEPVYRLGGEEFVILLPGRDARAGEAVAKRMWEAVRERPLGRVSATMSFGVASSAGDGAFDFDAVFTRADRALYAAKRCGRDQVVATNDVADGPAPNGLDSEPGAVRALRFAERRQPRRAPTRSGSARTVGLRSTRAAQSPASPAAKEGRGVTEDLEREHILELMKRLGPLYAGLSLSAFVVIATAVPWVGWHALIPPLAVAGPLYLLMRSAGRLRNPDHVLATGLFLFQGSIAAGFLLTHGRPLFALGLLVLMVPGPAAVHSARTGALFTAYTALLMTAVAFKLDANQVLHNPALLLFPLALLVECGYVGFVVGSSTVDFRGTGILDDLTGLLNRTALGTRLMELDGQADNAQPRMAIVLADVDHFKAINDLAGHNVGDVVLEEVAARIRACVRTFDSAYRIGGEEFLILIPDAQAGEAARLAQRVWRAIRSAPCVGLAVTISVGVAVATEDGASGYEELFGRADEALYEAKRAGRDRVCVDSASAGGPEVRPGGVAEPAGASDGKAAA